MTDADLTTNDIMHLYEHHGGEDYDGEPVSQASHMIQCAMLAISEHAGDELIVGAFLHDLGHLLKHRQLTDAMGTFGVVNHESIGGDFLHERGFSERVRAVVEMHVQAKRYLVATEVTYKDNLSAASLQTLEWQGGPMSQTETGAFRQHPYFDDIIRVRKWDEQSKDPKADLLPLSYFRNLVLQHLSKLKL